MVGFDISNVPFNADGWGPPETTTSSVPFAPFSRSDKLGRIADWTRSNYNNPNRSNNRNNNPSDFAFDFTTDDSFGGGLNAEEDSTFRLVDGKPAPRPKFGPKWRFQNNRNQLPQRRDEEVEARKREAEKQRARRDSLYHANRPGGNIMLEEKKLIGLSWEPNLPSLLFGSKSRSQNVSESSSSSSSSSLVYKPTSELIDGRFVPPNDPKKVNKLLKKQVKDTTGKSWFDMPAPTLTPELKKDLKLLKLRNVIDPKRHYKKGDSKFPKYFQVGTVVEPVSEYFTSRLSKKERKPTLADELLSDQSLKVYRKRKVQEIEEKNQPRAGSDKWKIKGKSSWKRAKQRRR